MRSGSPGHAVGSASSEGWPVLWRVLAAGLVGQVRRERMSSAAWVDEGDACYFRCLRRDEVKLNRVGRVIPV